VTNPQFFDDAVALDIPRDTIPREPMPASAAYQLVMDEAMLDGNARLNLATFVTTWMDEEADKIYAATVDKNMIDKDEYPQTAEIERWCAQMVARLWHAPDLNTTIGVSTVGSSEACMLGGLALKRRWHNARKAAGKDTAKPNLVMSSAVQVVWEKFCNYWDIEARYVPISDEHPTLDGENVIDYLDENTIGVIAIMGVTYTGAYEPVSQIAKALDEYQAKTGLDIPIHVDGASGGFIAPFLQPDIEWDFRLERVKSINTSGHKYGLVYPGLGWVVWRTKEDLPEDLIFNVSYLGGNMPTLALNFSRPGAQVLLQYYLFLRLGFQGYKTVQQTTQDVAMYLSKNIGQMPAFTLLSDGSAIPVFAWQLTPGHTKNWTLYDLQQRLRARGWLIPAYPLPDNKSDQVVQRIVVRNGMNMDLASNLLRDIQTEVDYLDSLDGPLPAPKDAGSFHH
jgi:glutamate decarboxylase